MCSETLGIQPLGTVDMAPKNLEGQECPRQGLNFGFAQESRTPVCRPGGLSGHGRERKRMNVRLEVEGKSCSNLWSGWQVRFLFRYMSRRAATFLDRALTICCTRCVSIGGW